MPKKINLILEIDEKKLITICIKTRWSTFARMFLNHKENDELVELLTRITDKRVKASKSRFSHTDSDNSLCLAKSAMVLIPDTEFKR